MPAIVRTRHSPCDSVFCNAEHWKALASATAAQHKYDDPYECDCKNDSEHSTQDGGVLFCSD
jgi:hypothetical protein